MELHSGQLTFYSIASRKETEAPGVFLGTAGYLDNWRIRVSQWKRQKTKALCLDLHVLNALRQNFMYPSLQRSHANENQRIYLVLKLKRTSVDIDFLQIISKGSDLKFLKMNSIIKLLKNNYVDDILSVSSPKCSLTHVEVTHSLVLGHGNN